MSTELKVPEAGESISEVYIARWHKKAGDAVEKDEVVVEIETDKASMEVPAPEAGVIDELLKGEGEAAKVGEVIALIGAGNGAKAGGRKAAAAASRADSGKKTAAGDGEAADEKRPARAARSGEAAATEPGIVPSARRILEEAGLDAAGVEGSGKGGRITRDDALRAVAASEKKAETAERGGEPAADGAARETRRAGSGDAAADETAAFPGNREIEVVAMSPIRKRIAERLVQAQSTAALLTTFNEIDMSAVMALRTRYKESFTERHGIKLGFMSFFVKAVIEGLKEIPQLNAQIRGDDMVFHNYYDIGIAVGGGKGLVVPVIRNAEALGFAEIETAIADFGRRAKDNKIRLDELKGGTFTISNGGVYGSLLSTPILNPPQSGVLGLHAIQERPVGIDGQIVLRPMMNVALTYDHRIVDGREAVTFLVRIKQALEDPARMLLEV